MTLTSGMHNGLGLSQIGACVYPYPSWAEGIKHLSDQYTRKHPQVVEKPSLVEHLNKIAS